MQFLVSNWRHSHFLLQYSSLNFRLYLLNLISRIGPHYPSNYTFNSHLCYICNTCLGSYFTSIRECRSSYCLYQIDLIYSNKILDWYVPIFFKVTKYLHIWFTVESNLVVREGHTSNGRLLQWSNESNFVELAVPIELGFYVRLTGTFNSSSRLEIAYASYSQSSII